MTVTSKAQNSICADRLQYTKPDWRMLAKALVWRARTEGFSAIFAYPFGLLAFLIAISAVSLWTKTGDLPTVPVGGPFGVRSQGFTMSIALLGLPGLLTLGVSVGGGRTVQSVIGSESATGTFEILLAEGFQPKDLAKATLAVVSMATGVLWTSMTSLAALLLLTLDIATHAHLHLSASYVVMSLILPPILALAGTCLAVALGFASPTLTQPAQRGMTGGTGAVIGTIAALPGIAMTAVSFSLGGRVSALSELGIGLGLSLVLAAGSWWVMRYKFGYNGLLRST